MNLKFKWEQDTAQYATGENLFINKIPIAKYSWNGSMSRDESKEYKDAHQYVATILLPGFATDRIYAPDVPQIKAKIERMVTNWFAEINRV